MKGIYLTEEGKKAIEDRIAELEKEGDVWSPCFGIAMDVYQEIISSATILPVAENWKLIVEGDDNCVHYIENIICVPTEYPNGVIIEQKNKQS
jgi:hypothetical protein